MVLKDCKTKIVLQLKELGFPVNYAKGYWSKQYRSTTKWDSTYKKKIIKPTQALVVKWFRDVHKLAIEVQNVNILVKSRWLFEINQLPCGVLVLWDMNTSPNFSTYELAEEAGIIEAIKILKERQNGREDINRS